MKVFANLSSAVAAALSCLFIGGCFVQSIHPIYRESSVVERPELWGEWRLVDKEDEENTVFAFSEGELEISGVEGASSESVEEFYCTFFEVEGILLLDLYPAEGGSPYFNMHVYPTHGLTIVEREGDVLRLIPLDEGEFHEGLEDGKIDLPYVKAEDAWALITASSEEWESFLRGYLKRQDVLDRENAVVLKRM